MEVIDHTDIHSVHVIFNCLQNTVEMLFHVDSNKKKVFI